MTPCLIFFISSIVLSIVQQSSSSDSRDIIPGGVQCSRAGPMCKDCMTLVECVKGAKDFEIKMVGECSVDAPCDESQKACVFGGTCRYKEFECSGLLDGTYPDPYSCRQYHQCQSENVSEHVCTFPTAYNPKTNKCDLQLEDKECTDGPIGVCKAENQEMTINDVFVFNCTSENEPLRILYPKLEVTFDCNSQKIFADPNDCTAYFYCSQEPDGTYHPIHKKCRTGSRFDPALERCVAGNCHNS